MKLEKGPPDFLRAFGFWLNLEEQSHSLNASAGSLNIFGGPAFCFYLCGVNH
ncbi:MAG: hypothetical protein IKI44_01505 [Bacteroidaceae bacterium]|nr:hypothetical protein [Bacteroidaceae bacterium]